MEPWPGTYELRLANSDVFYVGGPVAMELVRLPIDRREPGEMACYETLETPLGHGRATAYGQVWIAYGQIVSIRRVV
jgi:hypothetical protein